MNYLVVGTAGILGALLRFWLGEAVEAIEYGGFPLATLLANVTGCLALGWFTGWLSNRTFQSEAIRLAIGTGLIGSFTTFSTFSLETWNLMLQEMWGYALLYIMLSLWGGLGAAWLGSKWGTRGPSEKQGAKPA